MKIAILIAVTLLAAGAHMDGGAKAPDAGVHWTKPRINIQQVSVCVITWPDGGVTQDASGLCEVLRQAL